MRVPHSILAAAFIGPNFTQFLARDSHLCYDVSVRLSVTEVHWHIIADVGFKIRSQFTTQWRIAVTVHAAGMSTELF